MYLHGTPLLPSPAVLTTLSPPQHYLCWSSIPVPRISVIFSLEELKEIEKDCAVYVGRMERVARHSSISKEEKVYPSFLATQWVVDGGLRLTGLVSALGSISSWKGQAKRPLGAPV